MFYFVHANASPAPVGATSYAIQRSNITTADTTTITAHGGGLHSWMWVGH